MYQAKFDSATSPNQLRDNISLVIIANDNFPQSMGIKSLQNLSIRPQKYVQGVTTISNCQNKASQINYCYF